MGVPPSIAVLCGLACGAFCGYINGLLVARMKLPPFIVTLGMWQIILASNFLYSANETIRSQDIATQAPLLRAALQTRAAHDSALVREHVAWALEQRKFE